jgi:DnaJ-class molecular chaperone
VKSMTFYEFFEVKEDATREEIRAAYRKMLLRWHPDHCKDPEAEHWTKEVLRIWKILGDPEERRRYDAYLRSRREVGVFVPNTYPEAGWGTNTSNTPFGSNWPGHFRTSNNSGFSFTVQIF